MAWCGSCPLGLEGDRKREKEGSCGSERPSPSGKDCEVWELSVAPKGTQSLNAEEPQRSFVQGPHFRDELVGPREVMTCCII